MNPTIELVEPSHRLPGRMPPGDAPTSAEELVTTSLLNTQGIRSNLIWMLVGTFWSGFCQWTLLVVLAKLGTVEMVGAFTLGMAIALPILMFSCLSLRSLYVTDGEYGYRFLEYLSVRLITAAGSVALALALALLSGYDRRLVWMVTLITLAKAIEYTSDILYGVLQRQERMAAISISMMIRGTLSLILLALGIWIHGSLIWGAAGLVASAALVLIAFDLPVCLALLRVSVPFAVRECRSYGKSIGATGGTGYRRMWSLALSGLPLGLVLMLVSLNLNIPRYFLERSLGLREQGIFSSLANLVAAGSIAVGAIGQCVTPRLARHFSAGQMREFWRLLWVLVITSLGLGAAGFIVALTMGRQVLTLIYRPEYATHQDVFVWLMGVSAILYLGSIMGVAVTAVRCFTPQVPLFAASAASTALACLFLVPRMGLRGAALAILISAFIQSIGGVLLLRRTCRLNPVSA